MALMVAEAAAIGLAWYEKEGPGVMELGYHNEQMKESAPIPRAQPQRYQKAVYVTRQGCSIGHFQPGVVVGLGGLDASQTRLRFTKYVQITHSLIDPRLPNQDDHAPAPFFNG